MTVPSDWVSSIVIVRKPNGTIRVCIDPKDLNRAICRPHFQIPTVEEVAMDMAKAKVFSVMD